MRNGNWAWQVEERAWVSIQGCDIRGCHFWGNGRKVSDHQGRLPSNAWNRIQDTSISSLILWVLVRLGLCAKPSPGSHR